MKQNFIAEEKVINGVQNNIKQPLKKIEQKDGN